MKKTTMEIRPWYFKDGTPFNPETIRQVVQRSGIQIPRDTNRHVTRRLVVAAARYFSHRLRRQLEQMLFAQFDLIYKRRFSLSGDQRVDAKRLWRRSYMRQYRAKARIEQGAR